MSLITTVSGSLVLAHVAPQPSGRRPQRGNTTRLARLGTSWSRHVHAHRCCGLDATARPVPAPTSDTHIPNAPTLRQRSKTVSTSVKSMGTNFSMMPSFSSSCTQLHAGTREARRHGAASRHGRAALHIVWRRGSQQLHPASRGRPGGGQHLPPRCLLPCHEQHDKEWQAVSRMGQLLPPGAQARTAIMK